MLDIGIAKIIKTKPPPQTYGNLQCYEFLARHGGTAFNSSSQEVEADRSL